MARFTPAVIIGFRPTFAVIIFVRLSRLWLRLLALLLSLLMLQTVFRPSGRRLLLFGFLIVSFEHFISFGSAPHICIGACADVIFFCWARFILAARLWFDARAAVVVYLYLSIRCHCAGLVGYRGGGSARHR